MYLVTGLGQPGTRRTAPPTSDDEAPPRRGQRRRGQRRPVRTQTSPSPFPDQSSVASGDIKIVWSLNVPFRKDFEAFRQEAAKKMGLHYIKEGRGPHTDNTNINNNDKILKVYHDYALKHDPPMREVIDSVTVKAQYWFTQEDESNRSKWIIVQP